METKKIIQVFSHKQIGSVETPNEPIPTWQDTNWPVDHSLTSIKKMYNTDYRLVEVLEDTTENQITKKILLVRSKKRMQKSSSLNNRFLTWKQNLLVSQTSWAG